MSSASPSPLITKKIEHAVIVEIDQLTPNGRRPVLRPFGTDTRYAVADRVQNHRDNLAGCF